MKNSTEMVTQNQPDLFIFIIPRRWRATDWADVWTIDQTYTKVAYFMDFFDMDGTAINFLTDLPTWGLSLGPKLHPGGGFSEPWSFLILQRSHQDLSNEVSNFISNPFEVGHWVAQTQSFLTNYQKSQILASYNNLNCEFAKL